jgi:hydrogenase maturation factor
MSEGSLLVSLADGQKLVDSLLEKGIKSAIIGKVTDSNDKVIINEDERKFITKPCPDELFKYI